MISLVTFLAIPAMSQDMDMGLEPIGGQDNNLFKTMLDITTTMNEEKALEAEAIEKQAQEDEKINEVKKEVVKAENKAAKHKYLLMGAMVAIPACIFAAVKAGVDAPEDPNQKTMRVATAVMATSAAAGLVLHTVGSSIRNARTVDTGMSWNPKENPLLAAGIGLATLQQTYGAYNTYQQRKMQHELTQSLVGHADKMTTSQNKMQDAIRGQTDFAAKFSTDILNTTGQAMKDNKDLQQALKESDAEKLKLAQEHNKTNIRHFKQLLQKTQTHHNELVKKELEIRNMLNDHHAHDKATTAKFTAQREKLQAEIHAAAQANTQLEAQITILESGQAVQLAEIEQTTNIVTNIFDNIGNVVSFWRP